MKFAITTTTGLPPAICPACHRDELEGAVGAQIAFDGGHVGSISPRPGDITMCSYCFVFLAFTDKLGLRLLTNREWLALSPEHRAFLAEMRDKAKVDFPAAIKD